MSIEGELVAFEATGEPRIREDEVCAVELEPPVGHRKLAVEKRLAERPAHRELGIEPTGGAIDLRHEEGQRRERLGRAVQPSGDRVLPIAASGMRSARASPRMCVFSPTESSRLARMSS